MTIEKYFKSALYHRLGAEVVEQGLGFVGPSVRLISYSKWSGNTFSGFPGTETNIIIQYFHCSGWMTMENMVFMESKG